MARILAFTKDPLDWQSLLADPAKHWKTGFSARTLAHSWEAAEGFPAEVEEAFKATTDPELSGLTPVLAVPEFKVPLPGGERSSQNDIFVLARNREAPVAIMVEGKVDESFGPTVGEWIADPSEGRKTRLAFLLKKIALDREPPQSIRYQFLHRAASAVITAEQYRAAAAVMLVHSFSKKSAGWTDYADFLDLYSVEAVKGRAQRLSSKSSVPLFAAWVTGDEIFLSK
jgi:hypothetical protein